MKNRSLLLTLVVALSTLFLVTACTDDDDVVFTPKPKAYFRIDFPEKKYKIYDSVCPFTFETPLYSIVENDVDPSSRPCWINIKYPQFKAQLHVSYAALNNDLNTYIESSRELAIKHQIKASGLDQQVIIRDSAQVYGLFYDIAGNTASSMQFYVTDSTNHFLRGSLYFNVAPNIDSMQIVVDYLKTDVLHMIQTFKWKQAIATIKK
ncbi:MAG TPA: gliding motility lipoprotein GldD [Bacteroidia bacterium]